MINYNITKIQILAILKGINNYTRDPSIIIPCDALKKGIIENNITFDLFEHFCITISTWYLKNLSKILENEFVNNKDSHIENKKIIDNIVIDIKENIVEYDKLLSYPCIKKENPAINKNNIFIVHGHDDGLKNEVARFLEKLGFKPIILNEQASSGDTIIEKIERYSNVGFGIVLYTPCDVGNVSKDPTNLKPRARQNVIFEHGYLIGKLERQNVVALVKDDVEKPNDISGVVYVNYGAGDGWKTNIAKELSAAGYTVDYNKIFQ